jgi:hypothetical protein
MADRLLELLRKRETSGAVARIQTPRYMDAMVLSKGTIADINQLRPIEAITGPSVQSYNVAVDGTQVSPAFKFAGSNERYVYFDYQDEDYVDPLF